MKLFNQGTDQLAAVESELRNMLRAQTQVRSSQTEARVLEPAFWTKKLSSTMPYPAIVMTYGGRYCAVCMYL